MKYETKEAFDKAKKLIDKLAEYKPHAKVEEREKSLPWQVLQVEDPVWA